MNAYINVQDKRSSIEKQMQFTHFTLSGIHPTNNRRAVAAWMIDARRTATGFSAETFSDRPCVEQVHDQTP
jgi:hypothetical protein